VTSAREAEWPPELDDVGRDLLEAASRVLAADGATALTVRRIAAEAGMSTMNVYSRFGSKDGIVEHLWVEGFSRLREATRSVPETDDPLEDLRQCGIAYRRFASENRTYYSVMFERVVPTFEPSHEAAMYAVGALGLLADRFRRAMDAGVLPRRDAFETAASVWAAFHGVVSLELRHAGPRTVDWEKVYRTTTAALVAGLVSLGPDEPPKRRGRPAR
jgi:AcrR family transcriptional regulator